MKREVWVVEKLNKRTNSWALHFVSDTGFKKDIIDYYRDEKNIYKEEQFRLAEVNQRLYER